MTYLGDFMGDGKPLLEIRLIGINENEARIVTGFNAALDSGGQVVVVFDSQTEVLGEIEDREFSPDDHA